MASAKAGLFHILLLLASSTLIQLLVQCSNTNDHVDLLVHFTEYLLRDKAIEFIGPLLTANNIHHKFPRHNREFSHTPMDFLKIQLSQTDIEPAKIILKNLPNFKSFSFDRVLSSFTKDMPFTEKPGTYDYFFPTNLTEELELNYFWEQNITGKGIKIAIFDTGISETYRKQNEDNIKKEQYWSNEEYQHKDDFSGHGTFVTSIITNNNTDCPGIAPDAELYIFKVFTKTEETSYSWFLEAFNFCLKEKIDIVNFSLGSTNLIEPEFIEKIKEATQKGIIIVAAAGNDGPFFGTINHPADLNEVLAVGGVDSDGANIALYSSRGMTNSELVLGMGRLKPDIVTFSREIISADIDGKCGSDSGTSFAVPVITGSLALMLSSLEPDQREKVNPALIRQVLVESAIKLKDATMYEQGAGLFDLKTAFDNIQYSINKPKVTLFPSKLNLSDEDVYSYPYSLQPIYYTGVPTVLNLTVHNSLGMYSKVEDIEWISSSTLKKYIDIKFESTSIFPYFGNLVLFISLNEHSLNMKNTIEISGRVKVNFSSSSKEDDAKAQKTFAEVALVFQIIQTPPRQKRILWDQFHNMKFPESGFIPRDSLINLHYPYEWHGDHPFINFFQLFKIIQKQGYYLEILRGSFECFDASKYGILLIVDPEDKYSEQEISKLERDIVLKGLSVIVFAEWYDPVLMNLTSAGAKAKSPQMAPSVPITPVTGGSNIPALNTLLNNFGVALGTSSYSGDFNYGNRTHSYLSGSYIIRFPKNGFLLTFSLFNESDLIIHKKNYRSINYETKPILGMLRNIYGHPSSGKLLVYGDSNCIDSAYMQNDCFDLFKDMLRFVESETMNLLDHFKNYELHANYVANEDVMLYNESAQPLMKNYSKHYNPDFWDKKLFCEAPNDYKTTIDFVALKAKFDAETAIISDWESEKKTYADVFDDEDSSFGEGIQGALLVVSVALIIFTCYLIKRRRRKFRYSPMERAKGQIIVV